MDWTFDEFLSVFLLVQKTKADVVAKATFYIKDLDFTVFAQRLRFYHGIAK